MANFISILRVLIAFVAIGLLFERNANAYYWALGLTIIAFAMDGLDGYVARKFNETSELGSVLDIMGDRIVEASYWIVFAVLGWLSIIFPLICVSRAFITDGLRSVALAQGYTAFGEKSMQKNKLGSFICSSKFMRIFYAAVKALAFVLLIVAHLPSARMMHKMPHRFHMPHKPPHMDIQMMWTSDPLGFIAMTLAWIAIILCVVRGLPVIIESGKLFKKVK